MTPLAIRAATLADVPGILAIEQSAPEASHWTAAQYQERISRNVSQTASSQVPEFTTQAGGPDDVPVEWRRTDVPNSRQSSFVLLAESGDQVSGFICARIVAGEWEIENIVVEPDSRRRGFARELMQSLIAAWEQARGTALLLEVRESNLAARAVYAAHGLAEVGRRARYYRNPDEDAILYARYRDGQPGI